MSQTSTNIRITQVATVMVPVSDQDKSIEFFTEKLGFEKRADVPMGEGYRWVEVAPPGAATTVALVTPLEGEPVGIDMHMAFATGEIDADHAALRAAGVDVDEAVSHMGDPVPPMFWFRDLDGNRFLIVQAA